MKTNFFILLLVIIIVDFQSFAFSSVAPPQFKNCISSSKIPGFLVLDIKTNKSPIDYSLSIYEVCLIRDNGRDIQRFNSSQVNASIENNMFRIRISESLILNDEYKIGVTLYDEKRDRLETYI
jgi:hypothetical protein